MNRILSDASPRPPCSWPRGSSTSAPSSPPAPSRSSRTSSPGPAWRHVSAACHPCPGHAPHWCPGHAPRSGHVSHSQWLWGRRWAPAPAPPPAATPSRVTCHCWLVSRVTCLVSLGRLIIQLIPVCLLWSPPLTLFSLAGMETVLTEPSWKVDTLPWSHKNTAQGNWCTTGKFDTFYENMVYIKNDFWFLLALRLLQISVNRYIDNATFVCAK